MSNSEFKEAEANEKMAARVENAPVQDESVESAEHLEEAVSIDTAESVNEIAESADKTEEHKDESAVTEASVDELSKIENLEEGQENAVDEEEKPQPFSQEEQELIVEEIDRDELAQRIKGNLSDLDEEPSEEIPVVDFDGRELAGALEALLFVSTKPMKVEKLCGLLPGTNVSYVTGLLKGLSARYEYEQRGWALREIGGGWQMLTNALYHPWVRQIDKKELPTKLGKSAMETLAIVAYKQPITRVEIEDIRGVQCGPMLRQLMDMKLVQVLGRREEALGKPLEYGTTDLFLDRFGVSSPEELPKRHEFGS